MTNIIMSNFLLLKACKAKMDARNIKIALIFFASVHVFLVSTEKRKFTCGKSLQNIYKLY